MAVKQKRRKLSAKQIKYFGTKSQKAALKRRRSVSRSPARSRSVARRSPARSRPVARRSPARRPQVRTETNWLATALAGAGGFAAGGALGTIFGDKVKSTLSGLPLIGQYFEPAQPQGDMVNLALGGINPSISIAALAPAPGRPGTESEVYQDFWAGFNGPQSPGALEVVGGMATIRGQRESDNAPIGLPDTSWLEGQSVGGSVQ